MKRILLIISLIFVTSIPIKVKAQVTDAAVDALLRAAARILQRIHSEIKDVGEYYLAVLRYVSTNAQATAKKNQASQVSSAIALGTELIESEKTNQQLGAGKYITFGGKRYLISPNSILTCTKDDSEKTYVESETTWVKPGGFKDQLNSFTKDKYVRNPKEGKTTFEKTINELLEEKQETLSKIGLFPDTYTSINTDNVSLYELGALSSKAAYSDPPIDITGLSIEETQDYLGTKRGSSEFIYSILSSANKAIIDSHFKDNLKTSTGKSQAIQKESNLFYALSAERSMSGQVKYKKGSLAELHYLMSLKTSSEVDEIELLLQQQKLLMIQVIERLRKLRDEA